MGTVGCPGPGTEPDPLVGTLLTSLGDSCGMSLPHADVDTSVIAL